MVLKLLHKKSFTLVELVMTVIVVGLIAVPLAIFIARSIESIFQSKDYSTAVNLARCEMEIVKNLDYTDGPDPNLYIISGSFPNYKGYDYDVIRTVTYAYGGPATAESLKEIRVEVRRAGSAAAILTFVTYIARNVSYGI